MTSRSNPPSPPPAPIVDPTTMAVAAGALVLLLFFVRSRGKKAQPLKPLKPPKPLAAAEALRSQLSSAANLVEFGDPAYGTVRLGATWEPKLLKPRKSPKATRLWSADTHGTETWNMDSMGVPSAICRCMTVGDVQAVVRHAARVRSDHTLCVAGGRHSHFCLLDDALVLDLSLMRAVHVDAGNLACQPSGRIVKEPTMTLEGGCLNGDAVMAGAPHGLCFTVGHHTGTGLGGLVLQGGHGALERTTGLSIDSLLSCIVVLANGEVATASASENVELFWALRGGCGNFGVVVSFTFKLHPVGEKGLVMQAQRVHLPFAPMVKLLGWPDRAACVRAFADFSQSAALQSDPTLNAMMIMLCGGPVIHLVEAYTPRLADGAAKLHGIPFATSFGRPVDKYLKSVSYFHDVAFQAHGPAGDGQLRGCYYQSGALFDALPEEVVRALATAASASPGKEAGLILQTLGGAAAAVPDGATAYAQRAAKFFLVIYAGWAPSSDPATYARRRATAKAWVQETKAALRPHTVGAYAQLAGSESSYAAARPAGGQATAAEVKEDHDYGIPGQTGYGWYSGKMARLRKAKAEYDQTDLFVNTDHITPAP